MLESAKKESERSLEVREREITIIIKTNLKRRSVHVKDVKTATIVIIMCGTQEKAITRTYTVNVEQSFKKTKRMDSHREKRRDTEEEEEGR